MRDDIYGIRKHSVPSVGSCLLTDVQSLKFRELVDLQ